MKLMMKKTMHMGPISMKLKAGDVVEWNPDTMTFALNGSVIQQKGARFAEAMGMLNRQRDQNPKDPWTTVIKETKVKKGQPDSFKTTSLTMLPVLGCLKAAEEFLNKVGTKWVDTSATQKDFLQRYARFVPEIDQLAKILRRKADCDASVINKWLTDNGFDIQLPETAGNTLSVASILDLLVEWLKKGDNTSIVSRRTGETYKGVSLSKGVSSTFNEGVYQYPIVHIETKSGDIVHAALLDEMPKGEFGLADKVRELSEITTPYDASGVNIPMINYNAYPDISWIQGMRMGKGANDWLIEKAIQQTKFRLNLQGARVQSAVAMTLKGSALGPRRVVDINQPFILWIERPSFRPMPIFVGVFCEDVWKEPKDLSEM